MAVYREHPPSPALRSHVLCYWTLQGDAGAPARILPDGCADLMFDLAAARASAVGTMRTAAVVAFAGRVDLLGVRFRPGAARPLFGAPLGELTDRIIPADDEVAEQLAEAHDRIGLLESSLLSRMQPVDPVVAAAVSLIDASRGVVGVRTISDRLGVGERKLERRFDDAVGLSPKQFARVVRFRRVLRFAGRRPWVEIAAECGYADQAHLVREFGRLAGVSPVGFVQDGARTNP